MDLGMTGKTAIVTGASEGIGKGIARALAREGVDVAICARRKGPLELTAAEIAKESGRKIVAFPADLTKPDEAENFIRQAHAALGRIDILVNNAGSSPGGVLEHLSEADWAQSLQLKFMGYVRCMKHVLPIMQKQKSGVIINISSFSAVEPDPVFPTSSVFRAGLAAYTKLFADKYAADNVRMNNVLPGFIDSLAEKSEFRERIPMGRYGHVAEVSDVVAFLASSGAGYITGQNIRVDGGITRSP